MASGKARDLQRADGKFPLKNKIRVRIKQGDITKFPFEAVVVGENRGFDGQGAIAKSLLKAGGPLYKELRDDMIREAHLPSNADRLVFVSDAGEKFKFKKVLHAIVGSRRNIHHDNWFKHVEQLFIEVGKMADKHKIAQVGTPLLGTGAARGDVDVSLQAAITALASLSPSHLEDVIIVEYEAEKAVTLGEKLRDFFKLNPDFLYDDNKDAPRRPSPPRQQATPGRRETRPSSASSQPNERKSSGRRLPRTPADDSQGGNENSRSATRSGKPYGSSPAPGATRPDTTQGKKPKASDSSDPSTRRQNSQRKRADSASSPSMTPQPASISDREPPTSAPAPSEAQSQAIPQHHNNRNKNDAIRETNTSKKRSKDLQKPMESPEDSPNNASSRDERGASQTQSREVDTLTNMFGGMSIDDKNKQVRSAGSKKGQSCSGHTGQNQQMRPSSQPPGLSPSPGQEVYPPQGPPYPQQGNGQHPSFPAAPQPAQYNPQSYNMGQQQGQPAFPIPSQRPPGVSVEEWNSWLAYTYRVALQQAQLSQQSSYGWHPNVFPQQPIPPQGPPTWENQGHPVPQGQHHDGNHAGVVQLQHQAQQWLNPGFGPGSQTPEPQPSFSGTERQQGISEGNTSRDGQEDTSKGRTSSLPEGLRQTGGQGEGTPGLYQSLTDMQQSSSQLPPGSSLARAGQGASRGDNFGNPSSDVPWPKNPGKAVERRMSDREPDPQEMERGDQHTSTERMSREDSPTGDQLPDSLRRSQSNPANFPTWAQGPVSGDESQEFVKLPVDHSHTERDLAPPPLPRQPHSPRLSAGDEFDSQSQDQVQTTNVRRARGQRGEPSHGEETMEDEEKEGKEEEEMEQEEEEQEEEQQKKEKGQRQEQEEEEEKKEEEDEQGEDDEQEEEEGEQEEGEEEQDWEKQEEDNPVAEPEDDQNKEDHRRNANRFSGSHRGRSQSEDEEELTPQPQTGHGHHPSDPVDRTSEVDEERPPSSSEDQDASPSRDAPGRSSMPEGKMAWAVKENVQLDGFEPNCGTIVIEYSFANGVQQQGHPAPGQPYKGTFRRAFLPDNQEGQRVVKLLEKAFDSKLTFQLKENEESQEWGVEFKDIPHKTSLRGGPERNGYPDPEYLLLVETILDSLGIRPDP